MSSTLIVGLTGPSGAGKSTVASHFILNRIPVINADEIAREAVCPGSAGLKELVDTFSDKILNEDGTLNRRMLANICFADEESLKILNEITHPKIIYLIQLKIDELSKDPRNSIVILDAPTLFESGCNVMCDVVISVLASTGARLKRIQIRDKIDLNSAMNRISSQPDDNFYISKSDKVIYNDKNTSALTPQINNIIAWLRSRANEKANY